MERREKFGREKQLQIDNLRTKAIGNASLRHKTLLAPMLVMLHDARNITDDQARNARLETFAFEHLKSKECLMKAPGPQVHYASPPDNVPVSSVTQLVLPK